MHECLQCRTAECFCSVTGCVPMLSLASTFTRNPAAIIISTSRTRPKRSTVGGKRRLTRTVGGEKLHTRTRRRGRWQPRSTGRMRPHPDRGEGRRGRRRCLWRRAKKLCGPMPQRRTQNLSRQRRARDRRPIGSNCKSNCKARICDILDTVGFEWAVRWRIWELPTVLVVVISGFSVIFPAF